MPLAGKQSFGRPRSRLHSRLSLALLLGWLHLSSPLPPAPPPAWVLSGLSSCRFTFTATRGGSSYDLVVGDIVLYDQFGDVIEGAVASASSTGTYSSSYGPGKAVDQQHDKCAAEIVHRPLPAPLTTAYLHAAPRLIPCPVVAIADASASRAACLPT